MKRVAFVMMLLLAGCGRVENAQPAGNAARGQQLIEQYGCNVCHTIPDIPGPQGSLGPPLRGIAARPLFSMGRIENTPANLSLFIQNPGALNPQSSMPALAVPPGDARDIVAYLMTLR